MVITHVMKDGTRRDSIEGVKVPYNEDTKVAYEILSRYGNNTEPKKNEKEAG